MVILPFERTTIVYNGFIESPTAVQKNGIWHKYMAQGGRLWKLFFTAGRHAPF